MVVPNQIENILKDELHQLLNELRSNFEDPDEAEACVAMAQDAAMLPLRIARGEDVNSIVKSLKAEAHNRALYHRVRIQEVVTAAWAKVVARLLGHIILGAL
jgi:hypothetical protein